MEKTGKYYIRLGLPEGTSFPASPVEGDLFWRSDENFAYVYTGSAWRQLDAFIDATDTPGTYTGSGGYRVVVKDNETGLEFIPTLSGEIETFTDLTDTPGVYTDKGDYRVTVKSDETGLEFSASVSGEVETFLDLIDTPDNYTSHSGELLIVNAGESALEYVEGDLLLPGDVLTITDRAVGLGQRTDFSIGSDVIEHFDGATVPPTGWSWASYTGFYTPGVIQHSNSCLTIGELGGTNRKAFLYRTDTTVADSTYLINPNILSYTTGLFVGLRMDDGTDTNWVELGIQTTQLLPNQFTVYGRWNGGNNLGEVLGYWSELGMEFAIGGTLWTVWNINPILISKTGHRSHYMFSPHTGLTWTPTRWGIVFDSGSITYASWYRYYVDAVGYNT